MDWVGLLTAFDSSYCCGSIGGDAAADLDESSEADGEENQHGHCSEEIKDAESAEDPAVLGEGCGGHGY